MQTCRVSPKSPRRISRPAHFENDADGRDALALGPGKLDAAPADIGLIAALAMPVFQVEDDFVGARQTRRALDLVVGRAQQLNLLAHTGM